MSSTELSQADRQVLPNNLLFRNKVRIPIIQDNSVSRRRIDDELSMGLTGRLTLVTAPAGFGKTTAAADWAGRAGLPVVWFSIDSDDDVLKRFWSYLIAALDGVLPGLEARFSQYLYDISPVSAEGIVTVLVDELYNCETNFLIVLDDYHLIHSDAIHKSLELLIRYKPQNAHMLILSRSRPSFAAARLKAEGKMKEIRMAQLQFTGSEIAEYCRRRGLAVTRDDVKQLELHTEGWAAGLYLTLESAGSEIDFSVLSSASGRNGRQIISYLSEEVTGRWAQAVNSFMLRTCVLHSMTGALCDALTGRPDGREMLEKLSSSNAFIIPLDNEGGWYRYHHLFSEYLRTKLHGSGIDVGLLHEKAGEWYEKNGYPAEAVDHYLKGGKLESAVRIIERKGPEMVKAGDTSALSGCFGRLPDDVVGGNDLLCLTRAWLLELSGKPDEAEKWIGLIEKRYIGDCNGNMNNEWQQQMLVEIMAYRGMNGLYLRRPQVIFPIIMKYKQAVFAPSIFCSTGISLNQGDESLLPGIMGLGGHLELVDREYTGFYNSAREFIIRNYSGYIPVLSGEIAYERNRVEAAVPLLIKGMEEAEDSKTPGSYVPAVIGMARVLLQKGHIARALELLSDGEKKMKNMGGSHMLPVLAAFRARLSVLTEDSAAVNEWVRRSCLDIYDKPVRQRMFEYITLLRVLIFRKDYESCTLLLSRLLLLAEKEDNVYYRIGLLIQHSIILLGQGRIREAMEALAQALELGEKEGYERVFIEEGIPMDMLLTRFLKWNLRQKAEKGLSVSPPYVRKLLKCNREYSLMIKDWVRKTGESQSRADMNLQSLTRREKEVLRLLGLELTNAEIAATLDITVNTVKVNCSNIFRKLNVKNRDQAAAFVRKSELPKG